MSTSTRSPPNCISVGPETGLSDAREIWEGQNKPYSPGFCEADPCTDELESHLQQKGIPVDIVCCLLHLEGEGLHDSAKIAAFDFDGCLANTNVRRLGLLCMS